MNPPSEKVSQTPQSSASSLPPPSEPAATPMEESMEELPPLRSPKRPASTKTTSKAPSKASGALEIVSHSSAKAAKAVPAANPAADAPAPIPDTSQPAAPWPATAANSPPADPSATPAPDSQAASATETPDAQAEPASKEKDRNHPISPPSEPMQYRAIGLVRGLYEASEEQVTRGNIHTADGSKLDAVLLGRVISLVKKHIDLSKEHLWVVYPRTREEGDSLHVQVVGIWEPESLSKEEEEPAETAAQVAEPAEPAEPAAADAGVAATEDEPVATPVAREPVSQPETAATAAEIPTPTAAPVSADELPDGFFSIRGEIVHYAQETGKLVIKIKQQPRKPSQRPKAFKLTLKGTLDSPKVLRHFWELEVQRQGNDLVVQKGTLIGVMPPVKRRPSDRADRNMQKKRPPHTSKTQFKRPRQSAGPEKPGESGMPPRPRSPKPKPMKRNDPDRRSPRVPRNPL